MNFLDVICAVFADMSVKQHHHLDQLKVLNDTMYHKGPTAAKKFMRCMTAIRWVLPRYG